MKRKNIIYPLSVLSSGILWGIISLFIRPLSGTYHFSSPDICFIRTLISTVLMGLLILIKNPRDFRFALRDFWMFIGTGIVSTAVFNGLYFYTVIQSEVSVAVVLLYTSPVFLTVLGALFFGEKITPPKIAAVILTVIGCVLMADLKGGSALRLPVLLCGIGSGFFYALYSIFAKIALKKYNTLTVTFYTFLFGTAGLSFAVSIKGIFKTFTETPAALIPGLAIAVLCTVLPYLLYTFGLSGLDASRSGLLVAVEPLVGTGIGLLFFREDAGLLKLLGIAAILIALIVMNLPKKRTAPNH